VLSDPTTNFVRRLRAREPAAWFELWENFGPLLRGQLVRWGRGRIGPETVKDLSQETLAALTDAIDRHDPARGARFSTWLLAIAHHSFCGEMDRRMAVKRGSGRRATSLEEEHQGASSEPAPDARYEQAVFDAKVAAALRAAERECGFADFVVFRARVIEGQPGKRVAEALALSEATVSRRTAAVRERLRARLAETFAKYSFSAEEHAELARNHLGPNPNKGEDAAFDAAVAEVVHRIQLDNPAHLPSQLGVNGESGLRAPRSSPKSSLGRVVRSLFPFRDEPAPREAP
jgi:RNA polymerase sigma factor (sigma-70 family)